ncbi:uncharacterized protein EV420DRAFT_1584109 [Desarmillaria tabescens]|uniref:Nephrocystin 3-like N-terminal domain-containing protein n=1 Tax=Armillaria tabescens TaxID=1929756 RepID=A0AA39JCU1_ARMTA|nr:uncharacterized protein EV420DRAFT_1584109 [Desarmillaria tabescens]KAK0439451.1 hypothetical protein EV420DRAFT_1584109 [Desarmillaria tabescens]
MDVIAGGIIRRSPTFKTFKKQKTGLLSETIEIVVDVYDAMLLTYEEAIREEVLKKRDKLHCVYDTLFKQTIECSYFIKGYANKSVTGRVLSRNLLDKAKEFHEGFTALRDKLQSGISTETPVVTLGIRQLVDDLTRTDLNRNLRPLTEFCPTSTCMKGTRVETINVLMSWIADCSGGMLWCSGLAGTGKSSLAGTLHELLTTGGRNRLGAYLHYDHLGYSDASHLITSIAYSLGMYDNRIGTSISGVIRRNSALLSMSTASASEQFRALLQEPLERLPDLVNEGPLIVMIDGIDESDASKELLAVLSKGFGLRLPFIRLLVFSRSTETIFQAFSAPNSAVTTIVLNTTSEEISHDIRFFIGYHFSDIFANLSARNGSNDLQEFCEMFHAVDGLTERASGLLIWAATACRFIRESPSTSRLFALLDISASVDTLTFLYRTILDTIVSETDDHVVTTQSIRAVLGALVVKTPEGMTARALDTLVLLPEDTPARSILARLGSVIHETSTGYHQFFHSSFYDFLQNRSQCGDQWYIDVNEYKDRLHKRRWEVLKTMRSGTSGDLSSLL